MRITKVSVYSVEIPLVAFEEGGISPYITKGGPYSHSNRTLVKLDTDEGISSWGNG